MDDKVGASSTIPVTFMLPTLLVQTCENLLKQGITPDVYYNGHWEFERDDIKEHNTALVNKYFWRMRNL